MKLPRDISGLAFAKLAVRLGYEITRQTGSHIRLTIHTPGGDRHITIPAHSPLKTGTLHAILKDICAHTGLEKEEVVQRMM